MVIVCSKLNSQRYGRNQEYMCKDVLQLFGSRYFASGPNYLSLRASPGYNDGAVILSRGCIANDMHKYGTVLILN